jgi:hypothetical protein
VSTDKVIVFLGHPVEDRNENHFRQRLVRDLEAHGIAARVFANFHTTRRRAQRQIDILVVTDEHVMLIELKCLDQVSRLIGGVNGRWTQVFDDGGSRELDVNPYDQALSATFSVSDEMRSLADRGDVPPASSRKFFKHIDTVVCVYPDIPAGSQLDRADYVTLSGYEQLLTRLVDGLGPTGPAWTDTDWDCFARHLGVFRFDQDGEDPQLIRGRQVLEDYRRSFSRSVGVGMHDLITPSAVVDGDRVDALDLASHTRHASIVLVVGRSGAGKSHTARHTAVRLSRDGHLVMWARCGDGPTRLSTLLARAAAPHSTENPLVLIDTAAAYGRDAVLVLDGLNECPPAKREALLQDLASLRRRHRLSVVITSTDMIPPVGDSRTDVVHLLDPDSQQRTALLASYGAAGRPEGYATAFTTPLELSMAAACARDLAPDATRAELFRAFVRTQCPSVSARSVQREVARMLDERLETSLPIDEVLDHLERDPAGQADGAAIDAALASPLLVVDRGRVWFSHELIGRFLAAVELLHRPGTGAELAALLDEPRHNDLVEFVVDLDSAPAHRYDLLVHLEQPELLCRGLLGMYGADIERRLHADVRAAFAEGLAVTATARLEAIRPDTIVGQWRLPRELSRAATHLLVAASYCFEHGLFVDEVAALLEATDQAGETIMDSLRAESCTNPVSLFVASAYAGMRDRKSGPLPAQLVMEVLEGHKIGRSLRRQPCALAAQLVNSGRAHGRGLLYAAVQVLDVEQPEDRAITLQLIDSAWHAGAYHLKLETLNAIYRMPRSLAEHDAPLYEAVRQFLSELPAPRSLGLSGSLVDCLAAFGLVEPTLTVEEITASIDELLAAPSSHDVDELAYTVWSNQFEAEFLVGPVYEAVAELAPAKRVRLLTMAIRGRPDFGLFDASLIQSLIDEADSTDVEVVDALTGPATTIDLNSPCPQDAVGFHVAAIVALARLGERLPPVDDPAFPRAWRLVDELLHDAVARDLNLASSLDEDKVADYWGRLRNDHPGEAVCVLHSLVDAESMVAGGLDDSPYKMLVDSAPNQVRQLFEWGLRHPVDVPTAALFVGGPHSGLTFIIRQLGHLGDEDTAALLEAWAGDPDLGKVAVEEIRRLRSTPSDRS